MSMEEWSQLVQRVDQLIAELRAARAASKLWKIRAAELERLHLLNERPRSTEALAKDREIERLRRERKKVIATITKILSQLDQARTLDLEKDKNV